MDDLDDAIAQVYAQPPSDFVAARTALVKELKAAKRKDAAASVAVLRRPTKLAWAVGEAVRRSPEPAAAYFGAIGALAEPGDLRQRTADLRSAVAALVTSAQGAEPGEVTAALLAVAADPDGTEALRRGRLADLPASGGFGGLTAGFGAAGPSPVEAEAVAAAPDGTGGAVSEAGVAADAAAGEEMAAAEGRRRHEEAEARAQRIAALEAERVGALAAEEAATGEVTAARAAVQAAQAELDWATGVLDEARRAASTAAARLEEAVAEGG